MMERQSDKFIRRAFVVTWVLLFVLAGIFAYFMVKEANKQPDVNNYIGKSAYQVAVDNGFKGDEKMWLDSLKTPIQEKPKDGRDGKDSQSTTTIQNNTVEKSTVIEKQVPVNGNDGRTPELCLKVDTIVSPLNGVLYFRYLGDDDWQTLPACGGVK